MDIFLFDFENELFLIRFYLLINKIDIYVFKQLERTMKDMGIRDTDLEFTYATLLI